MLSYTRISLALFITSGSSTYPSYGKVTLQAKTDIIKEYFRYGIRRQESRRYRIEWAIQV